VLGLISSPNSSSSSLYQLISVGNVEFSKYSPRKLCYISVENPATSLYSCSVIGVYCGLFNRGSSPSSTSSPVPMPLLVLSVPLSWSHLSALCLSQPHYNLNASSTTPPYATNRYILPDSTPSRWLAMLNSPHHNPARYCCHARYSGCNTSQ